LKTVAKGTIGGNTKESQFCWINGGYDNAATRKPNHQLPDFTEGKQGKSRRSHIQCGSPD
jgi:hypothetical protein